MTTTSTKYSNRLTKMSNTMISYKRLTKLSNLLVTNSFRCTSLNTEVSRKGATTRWSATIRLTGWSVPTTQIRRRVRLSPLPERDPQDQTLRAGSNWPMPRWERRPAVKKGSSSPLQTAAPGLEFLPPLPLSTAAITNRNTSKTKKKGDPWGMEP
jgi:hypothetical protein